ELRVHGDVLARAVHDARYLHATLKLARLPFDGGEEAQLEQRRPQVARDARGDFHGAVGQRFDGPRLVEQVPSRLSQAVDEPQEIDLDRGEITADVVVNLARDARALLLLGALQV